MPAVDRPFAGDNGKQMISVRRVAPVNLGLIQAQKVYDKWCRNEALCGNPLGEVFRTCWSATCASPPAVTARCDHIWVALQEASENNDGLMPLRTPPEALRKAA